jgi:MFS family permease
MSSFIRDRFTWLGYLMLGYYAYMQATTGPLMTYLGAELQLTYVQRGLHFSAFALGMVLAGLTADRLAQRWGRGRIFWIGGFGMGAFASLLVFGKTPVITIAGALLMGYIGSWTLVMIQAALADRHGEQRTIALTESNVIASVGAMIAPALIGLLADGWRGALLAGFGAWLVLYVVFRRTTIPTNAASSDNANIKHSDLPSTTLPRIFWLYWLMGIVIGSIEWSIIFWASDFFERVVGLPKNYAATAVSAYFVANIIGRALGSRLARTIPAETLLLGVVIVASIGFPIFWLSPTPLFNIVGLFLAGLGVSNLYPFILAMVTHVAPDQSNTASARISMAMGVAMLVTPLVLASFADQVGIRNAYMVVIVLLGFLLGFAILSYRLTQKEAALVEVQ